MDVILLEKVGRLGKLGDTVKVKSGYARNFLIPGGHAVPATADNVAAFESRRAELEQAEAEARSAAEARKTTIEAQTVTIACRVGDEGRLFGSVGVTDIVDALETAGVEIERSEVRMGDGPLRHLGEHEVVVHLHADVNATLNVVLVAEE
ncbi:MAG: 50S ribosomal protein L9 [Chromatiales bacterium]|nr:50S ribosomal protein L9 [Chromatiales bacterium]